MLLLSEALLATVWLCAPSVEVVNGVAGSAVAGQFGLVGGLIGGAASGARAAKRDKAIAAAAQALAGLPLEQQLAASPHSFRVAPHEIGGLQKTRMGARTLSTAAGDFMVSEIADSDLHVLLAWLGSQGVAVQL